VGVAGGTKPREFAWRAEGAGLSTKGPTLVWIAEVDGAAGRSTKTLALVWRMEGVVVDVGMWTRTLMLVCRVEGVWEGQRRTLTLV
jgi:hypothetical protein